VYTVVSMPEFLAEGTAINDLVNPQRVVIGTESDSAFEVINHLIQGTKNSTQVEDASDNTQQVKVIHI